MQWREPKQMEIKMLVAVGKGIELEVDVSRLDNDVRDHVMRTGLRNLLMDAHASVTTKAYTDNYVAKSRELAEKKLASLYAGVVRTPSFGGPKAAFDPVATVILRLARKAVISRPEVTAASNADRLATINRLAAEYAKEHDAQLRPRAEKIVALENDRVEPAPIKKQPAVPDDVWSASDYDRPIAGLTKGQRKEGASSTRFWQCQLLRT
jgi:hypothetical protein